MDHTHMNFFWHFLCFSASLYAVASLNSDGKTLLSLLSHWNVVPTSIKFSWNASHSSPCSWDGVRCDDQTQFVVSLQLHGYNISGQLGHEIGDLKHLRSIDLSENDLFGSIPSELGNCSLLERLDFSSNSFTGELPQSIGNSQSLQFENSVSGTVPEYSSLCKLENLNSLVLSNNKLTGTIPDCFWNISSLTELNLRYNGFHGMIPITNLSNGNKLWSIRLNGNQLDGPLPSFLCNFENLDALALSDNKLTGIIPHCFWNMSNLSVLDLRRNDLDEMIPTNFPNGNSLVFLSLSGNRLEGPLPPSLCKLHNLAYLILSDNELTGTIHDCFWSNMSGLRELDLGENGFHGMVPTNFPKGKPLWFLALNGNQLEGPFPISLCKLQGLMYLLLSDNKLTGTIPDCIWNLTKLSVLDLRKNGFHGMIPTTFPNGNGTNLQFLDLNGNQLEGPLPKSLLNCTRLGILDVGHNNLTDSFPAWLGTLPKLSVLVLKDNRFHGTIRTTTSNTSFRKLRILDISYKQFNGFLPSEVIDTFQAMKKIDSLTHFIDPDEGDYTNYEDSVDLVTKGLDLELTRVSTIFSAIDLSGNRFEGSIPESIGELKSVKMLNFSRNQFEGVIPSTVGNMLALESLDLSWNQLGGEIPSELANLNFLEVLNLSQNRLEGRIPQGRQLSTFTISSYGGNPGLCGLPLKDCGEVPQSSQQSHHQRSVDLELMDGFGWETVLLGFGCGLLTGSLMFFTEKPKWFHEIVEDTCRQLKRTKTKKRKPKVTQNKVIRRG